MLVYGQDKRVTDWVAEQLGEPEGPGVCATIGWEVGGQLTAGVTFDNYTGTNIFAHIASTTQKLPLSLLIAVARYVFVQCKARRMTFLVADDNEPCRRLVSSLGAEHEFTLRCGHPGGSLFGFVLWDTSRFYRKLIATGRLAEDPQEIL